MKILLFLFIFSGVITKLFCQETPYNQGFENGFKKGYCYYEPGFCNIPSIPLAPLPSFGESSKSYQDGYNKGFQIGLDLIRLGKKNKISDDQYKSIPNYQFNKYVPEIPVDEYAKTGMYLQHIYDSHVQWIQKRIDNLSALCYSLLYNFD